MTTYLTAKRTIKCAKCKNKILRGQKFRVFNREPYCLTCAALKGVVAAGVKYYDYVMARRTWQSQYWNQKLRR